MDEKAKHIMTTLILCTPNEGTRLRIWCLVPSRNPTILILQTEKGCQHNYQALGISLLFISRLAVGRYLMCKNVCLLGLSILSIRKEGRASVVICVCVYGMPARPRLRALTAP